GAPVEGAHAAATEDEGVLVVRRPDKELEPGERECSDRPGVRAGDGPGRVRGSASEGVGRTGGGDGRDLRERDAGDAGRVDRASVGRAERPGRSRDSRQVKGV